VHPADRILLNDRLLDSAGGERTDGSYAWLVDSDEEEGHEIPWMTAVSGVF